MNSNARPCKAVLVRCCIPFLAALPFCALSEAEVERVPRPMRIHRVEELGIEIWTEADPRWETTLTMRRGQRVFSAETPALTYPPAGMTWVSDPEVRFTAEELEEAARGAIHQAARNYGIRNPTQLVLVPARYGEMSGHESRFSAQADGTQVDVLIFFGHEPGRPAVLVHAYTLAGKLEHLREHIRRSWTHLRYIH